MNQRQFKTVSPWSCALFIQLIYSALTGLSRAVLKTCDYDPSISRITLCTQTYKNKHTPGSSLKNMVWMGGSGKALQRESTQFDLLYSVMVPLVWTTRRIWADRQRKLNSLWNSTPYETQLLVIVFFILTVCNGFLFFPWGWLGHLQHKHKNHNDKASTHIPISWCTYRCVHTFPQTWYIAKYTFAYKNAGLGLIIYQMKIKWLRLAYVKEILAPHHRRALLHHPCASQSQWHWPKILPNLN